MPKATRSAESLRMIGFGAAMLVLLLGGSTFAAEKLVVGTWNIEWLGSPESRSGMAEGKQQKPEDLAAYIKSTRVDVLALEEIDDDDRNDDTYTNSILNKTFELLSKQTGQKWQYVLFPKKHFVEISQLTGVAWNASKLTLVGEPFKVPVRDDLRNDFDEWARHPYAVKFSAGPGKTDFVLIPIHMKSNRGDAISKVQRALEAATLVSALDSVRKHYADDDLVLLGDTNILKANEEAAANFTSAGFKDLNAGDKPTTFREDAPFDRIFVTAGEGEFQNSVLTVQAAADRNDHKRRLSDHYMITTVIDVIADEDPFADRTPDAPTASSTKPAAPETPPTKKPAAPAKVKSPVRIVRLLPNAEGDESQEESVTLQNTGTEPVDLAKWQLRDKVETTWSLQSLGRIAPGETKTIKRRGQEMALGNNGDEVYLIDPTGAPVDRVVYEQTTKGVEIVVSP